MDSLKGRQIQLVGSQGGWWAETEAAGRKYHQAAYRKSVALEEVVVGALG